MNLGTVRIDETIGQITNLALRNSCLELEATITGPMPAVTPDTPLMIYGNDGSLIIRTRMGDTAIRRPLTPDESMRLHYQLAIVGKQPAGQF